MTTESKKNQKQKRDGIGIHLWIIIGVPIIVLLIAGGGAVLWNGLKVVSKAMLPNIAVILGYIYFGYIGFVIAKHHYSKK